MAWTCTPGKKRRRKNICSSSQCMPVPVVKSGHIKSRSPPSSPPTPFHYTLTLHATVQYVSVLHCFSTRSLSLFGHVWPISQARRREKCDRIYAAAGWPQRYTPGLLVTNTAHLPRHRTVHMTPYKHRKWKAPKTALHTLLSPVPVLCEASGRRGSATFPTRP